MDSRSPLEEVHREYPTVPLEFNSENDVQVRLYKATREYLHHV
jgi:hypothetical protein